MARRVEPPTHYVQHASKAKVSLDRQEEDQGRCSAIRREFSGVLPLTKGNAEH
jgi:hypothetical protein